MLDRLKALFTADLTDDEPVSAFAPDDERIAVAALLIHMIRIDGEVTGEEEQAIRFALAHRYEVTDDELSDILAVAKRRDDEAVDLYTFTSILKARLGDDGRARVVEMLWEAVYADGVVNELEDNMVWRVAELLGVPARERMILRRQVARRQDADE